MAQGLKVSPAPPPPERPGASGLPLQRSAVCNMSAAPQLIWECVRKNNAFIRKSRNMPTMSAEPGNLLGLSSSKFSGIAAAKVLDISSKKTGDKETIILTSSHKKGSRLQRPGSRLLTTGLKKQAKKGLAQVDKIVDAGFYRRDLLAIAKTKYDKVRASFKKKKVVVKSRRAPK
uniref:Ribosomal eL28/Mak16 domain-containing protein n=1 Tax=Zooxanthella nutricula TaxID=1333877 RepID=A0A7S2J2U4_9DINO